MYKRMFSFLISFSMHAIVTAQQFSDNAPCIAGNPPGGTTVDWTQQNFSIHTNTLGSTTIQSPFFLNSLNNPNVNEFSAYVNKDFNTTDGWELWKYDFGTPTARNDVPYIVLYNKHTGLLRVFVAFANLLGQNNAISILLKYKDASYRSAVLENYNNTDARNATKKFSNNVKPVINSNYYLNSTLTWYHSDFYLHYDPCICNFKSSIVLEVKLSNNGNFNFTMNGTAIQNIPGGQSLDANGRFGEKGVFSSFLDIKNQPYKSISFFRDIFAGASLGLSILNSNYLQLPANTKSGFETIFQGFTQGIPVVSAFANFLTTIFNKNGAGQPVRPMVFDIRMTGKGTIDYTYNYSFNEFVLPGSEQTLLSTTILPYYNKPTGVFTLLTEPEILYEEWIVYQDEWTPEIHETDIQRVYKMKDEVINYSVNPHAGFDLAQSQIKGQLVFVDLRENIRETELFDLGCLKDVARYFQHHKSYSPTEPWANWEEGFVPYKVLLKIVANFKVAGTTLEVPYVATFNLNSVQSSNPLNVSQDQNPLPGCNTGFPTATSETVKAVCNSEQYKGLVSQFGRNGRAPFDDIDEKEDNLTAIYPNPVYNSLRIPISDSFIKDDDKLSVEIFNSSGIMTKRGKYSIVSNVIVVQGLDMLPPGMYVVRVINSNSKVLVSKFLKR